jgi:hypothetical protein
VVVAVAIAATAKTGSQALANSNWPLSYGFVLRWLIAILLLCDWFFAKKDRAVRGGIQAARSLVTEANCC